MIDMISRRIVLMVLVMGFPILTHAQPYQEAPLLEEMVGMGLIPPLEERLPAEPMIVEPLHEVGRYGGTALVFNAEAPSRPYTAQMLMGSHGPFRTSPEGSPGVPNVFLSYESNDDFTEWTLRLRPGIKWSDGYPLTAENFLKYWKLERANPDITPAVNPENVTIEENSVTFFNEYGYGRTVTKEVIDDYTLRYTSDVPYPFLINALSHPHSQEYRIQPMHFMQQFHPEVVGMEVAEELAVQAGFDTWFQLYLFFSNAQGQQTTVQVLGNFPPSLAPYVLVRRTPDTLTYERNPYYFKVDSEGKQLPYIDRIIVEQLPDRQLIDGKIISGEADFETFMTATENLPLYSRYEEAADYTTHIWNFAANATVMQPGYCYEDEVVRDLFRNREFRIALNYAIDRERINNDVLFGLGHIGRNTVLENTMWFKPEYETMHLGFDPALAMSMLDELGVVDANGDGWRQDPEGREVSWQIEYIVSEAPRTAITEIVEDNWRSIGLNVTVQLREATFGFERVNTNLVAMWVWHGDARTETLFPAFINSHMFGTWPGTCWWNYHQTGGATGEEPPPEMQEVFDAFTNMNRSTSVEEVVEWGQVMLDNAADNVWTLATVNDFPHPMVVKNDIKNFPTEADGPLIYEWSTWWTNAYEPSQFFFEDRSPVALEQSGLPNLYPVEELEPPVDRALNEGWL